MGWHAIASKAVWDRVNGDSLLPTTTTTRAFLKSIIEAGRLRPLASAKSHGRSPSSYQEDSPS